MKRKINFEQYKKACMEVIKRADEKCEVMIDEFGKACSDLPKTRCCKTILFDRACPINFLHKETRNGKSNEWVMSPDNIIYGCKEHHIEEERTGRRVEMCDYDEVYYIKDYD